MTDKDTTTGTPAAGKKAATATEEPRNVKVTVLKNRTKVRGAICAAGPLDFLLTATEAKALEDLGKVRIDGI